VPFSDEGKTLIPFQKMRFTEDTGEIFENKQQNGSY